MSKEKFPINPTLEAVLIHSFTIVFISASGLIAVGLFKKYGFELTEYWLGIFILIAVTLAAIIYRYLIPLFYRLLFPQKISCEYIPIEKQFTSDPNQPYIIKVEKMYQRLIELVKGAKSLKIVDNIHSQLDHLNIAQTVKRSEFHQAIINKFNQDSSFEYQRIELKYDPLLALPSKDIYKNIPTDSATKKHIDSILAYRGRATVQYLTTKMQIGTFIIVDNNKIIFQIDGVDFDTQIPSDLIILTVSNPDAELLKNYKHKFTILSQQAIPHAQIEN